MSNHVKPLKPPGAEEEEEAEAEKETLQIDEPEPVELSDEVKEAIRRRHRFGMRCGRPTDSGACKKPATWVPKGADRSERPACVLHVQLPATRWRPPKPAVRGKDDVEKDDGITNEPGQAPTQESQEE